MEGGPEGTLYASNKTGNMTQGLFLQYAEVFILQIYAPLQTLVYIYVQANIQSKLQLLRLLEVWRIILKLTQ